MLAAGAAGLLSWLQVYSGCRLLQLRVTPAARLLWLQVYSPRGRGGVHEKIPHSTECLLASLSSEIECIPTHPLELSGIARQNNN